jgi:hypothetical protein
MQNFTPESIAFDQVIFCTHQGGAVNAGRYYYYTATLFRVYGLSGSQPLSNPLAFILLPLTRRSMVPIWGMCTLTMSTRQWCVHDQVWTLPSVQWSWSQHDPGLTMTESQCDHSNDEGRVFLSSTNGLVPTSSRDTNNGRTANIWCKMTINIERGGR